MFNQVQSQKLQHKILPQHIALLNLLHFDSLALEQRIRDEINENPFLEEMDSMAENNTDKCSKDMVQDFQNWEEYGYDDIPDYKMEYENYLPADKVPDKPLVEVMDYRLELKKQYSFTESSEEKKFLANFLIDSLDEHGFLGQDLDSIAEEISFKRNLWVEARDLEKILGSIQELDPPGVGSRDIREFFLIQLGKMNGSHPMKEMTIRVIESHFQELRSANLDRICRDLHIDDTDMKNILNLLATLKTRPVTVRGNPMQGEMNVLPDFVVTMDGEELTVHLARPRSASLRISNSWIENVHSAEQDKATDKATKQYLRSKLSSAQWFIKAIRERETNMLKVMRAIMEYQRNYFLQGDTMQLKPMVLKNIADLVGLDISTVSRITCNKYADTPFGMILLKDLFTEGLVNKAGDSISNKVIREVVQELVSKEDKKKPYTDQQLANILAGKGYQVARRTIAKYRDQLHIPVAPMRALWV